MPRTQETARSLLTTIENDFPLGWGVMLARVHGFVPHHRLDYESKNGNAVLVVRFNSPYNVFFPSFSLSKEEINKFR